MKRAETIRGGRSTRDGFTLLEVLAAVAILGIWYMVIATLAMQGLQSEGESKRLLAASLVADDVIADLEASIAGGALLPSETTEEERDEFLITTEVTPFDIPRPPTPGQPPPPTGPPSAFSNLAGPKGTSPILQIKVEVEWTEGVEPRSVFRQTYALDLTSNAEKLTQLGTAIDDARGFTTSTDDGEGS